MSRTQTPSAKPSARTRVFVVDDHKLFCAGVSKLISGEPDMVVTGSAADGDSALRSLALKCFDVVLTDLSMAGLSGLDLIRAIREHHPQLPILVMTLHNSAQLAQAVIQAGANGFITKSADPDQLLQAIRNVRSGGHFMEAFLMERIAFDLEKPLAQRLSARQNEILGLLVTGMSNREIAGILQLSEKTVSTHKVRLSSKLGLQSRVELMRCVSDFGALLRGTAARGHGWPGRFGYAQYSGRALAFKHVTPPRHDGPGLLAKRNENGKRPGTSLELDLKRRLRWRRWSNLPAYVKSDLIFWHRKANRECI